MIVWFVSKVDMNVASFRYRALWIADAYSKFSQEKVLIAERVEDVPFGLNIKVIIIEKVLDESGLRVAELALKYDVPYVLDICDNVLVQGYGGARSFEVQSFFLSMSRYASAITVPTQSLSDELSSVLQGFEKKIFVVPDVLEDKMISALELSSIANENNFLSINSNELGKLGLLKTIQKILVLILYNITRAVEQPKKILAYSLSFIKAKFGVAVIEGVSLLKNHPKYVKNKIVKKLQLGSLEGNKLDQSSALEERLNKPIKHILWFGNSGAEYGEYGISTILHAVPALEKMALTENIKLTVMSNSEALYKEYLSKIKVPKVYVKWSVERCYAKIAHSDLIIIPSEPCPFSSTKSPNRAVLALSQGVPVLAEPLASYGILEEHIRIQDDWYHDICAVLDGTRNYDWDAINVSIKESFSPLSIAKSFQGVLGYVALNDIRQERQILFLIDLVQDYKVLMPIIRFYLREKSVRVKVLVSKVASYNAPVEFKLLKAVAVDVQKIQFSSVNASWFDEFKFYNVVIVGAETNLSPHKLAHKVVYLANQKKIKTVSFQHGLENVGLSYFDDCNVEIESSMLITWNEMTEFSNKISPDIRAKIKPLGMFKEVVDLSQANEASTSIETYIAVYENLHWDRYTEAYRNEFVSLIKAAAVNFPEIKFIIKMHPAGKWINGVKGLNQTNIIKYDDFISEGIIETPDEFMNKALAVITTPSTIAVDACLLKKNTAIIKATLPKDDLHLYKPLTFIESLKDVNSFITLTMQEGSASNKSQEFIEKTLLDINAFEALDTLIAEVNVSC